MNSRNASLRLTLGLESVVALRLPVVEVARADLSRDRQIHLLAETGDARGSEPWLECGAEKWKLLSPVLNQTRPQQRQYEDFSKSELLCLRGEAGA